MNLTQQALGSYITYGGYAVGLAGIVLALRHPAIVVTFTLGIALVAIGRQLEK
jgi:hypothetical protein